MTTDAAIEVSRHRTAMVRHSLSQPVALLVRHGLLHAGKTMFDYGCGQGDDLKALSGGGIDATGWDPHFKPDAEMVAADVVNLGFVLNVVEDVGERQDALTRAWELTKSVLAVSTMIVGQVPVEGLRPFRDGYLTSRGTFQKYFQQAELRDLIADTLGVSPIAAAPGIFFVFRHEEDAAEHLLARRSSWRVATAGFRSLREATSRPELAERIADEASMLADLILDRGRAPQIDEIPIAVLDRLACQRVSLGRALEAARALMADGELREAQERRQEDLIVHGALAMLNPTQGRHSERIARDIRALFGSQAEFAAQAKEYLFGLANADRMIEAMREAEKRKLGIVDERGRLLFLPENLGGLPGQLRCYAGCVTLLSGEPAEFVYRLDPSRRRATLIVFENRLQGLPISSHEVRIDLARQTATVSARRRRLLRLADLSGFGTRAKQRETERRHREKIGVGTDLVFETIELPGSIRQRA